MEKNKEILDEILKALLLEGLEVHSYADQLNRIIQEKPRIEMLSAQKAKLLEQLSAVRKVETLGQVISDKLSALKMDPDVLSRNTCLSSAVLQNLIEDKVYTNNIPIMFFQKLLTQLGITFQQAEKAIRETFSVLQKNTMQPSSHQSFSPAFRKGSHILGAATLDASAKGEGRELYENEEALDRYLTRLNQLLNQG